MTNVEIVNFGVTPIELLLADARRKLVETDGRNRLLHVNRKNVNRGNANRKNVNRENADGSRDDGDAPGGAPERVLDIVKALSDDVYHTLKTHKCTMRFVATGKDPAKPGDGDGPLLEVIGKNKKRSSAKSRYRDYELQIALGPDRLQKRLIQLNADARTAEEEQGVNILYLALGFLNWFEAGDVSGQMQAPLILLPVELKRNIGTATYDISFRDDEIVTNLCLKKKLHDDYGINLPEITADEQGWTPSSYFEKIAELIRPRSTWSIEPDGMQLGFFSFAKLLMSRDLESENWSNGDLEASPLINGLLHSGFPQISPLFGEFDRLDAFLSPGDMVHVVDADAPQAKVIEEVRAGRNLVIQGPPGTGKSQTITNLIAAAVHDGKSVLVVAEKMAALSAVHDRLKGAGLETICLELHSRAAGIDNVLEQLADTLSHAGAVSQQPQQPERLKSFRDGLNFLSSILHSPIEDFGETPFNIMAQMARLVGQGVPAPTLSILGLANISIEELSELEAAFEQYDALTRNSGPRRQHPFAGTHNMDLPSIAMERLSQDTAHAAQQLGKLDTAAQLLGRIVDFNIDCIADIKPGLELLRMVAGAPEGANSYFNALSTANRQPRLHEALAIAREWQDELINNTVYNEKAWSTPAIQLRAPLANGIGSFLVRSGSAYRDASRALGSLLKDGLPKKADQRLQLLNDLIFKQAKRKTYREQAPILKNALGRHWQDQNTPFSQISAVLLWMEKIGEFDIRMPENQLKAFVASPGKANNILRMLDNLLEVAQTSLNQVVKMLALDARQACGVESFEQASLKTLVKLFSGMNENVQRYGEWQQLEKAARKIEDANLSSLLGQIDSGAISTQQAKQELRFARVEAIWNVMRARVPQLDEISKSDRHRFVEHFKACEYERFDEVRELIRSRHLGQLPSGATGQMAVLGEELDKKTNHKPIRKLFVQAGPIIQKIKPVLLMSPVGVARFLPPEQISFDLLIIDEASQMRPQHALGAIARCRQMVVVGDQRQMPPTDYFERLTSGQDNDEDEEGKYSRAGAARVGKAESILSLCQARSIPERVLKWHYRSRDPSLIAVSNREFYKNNLIVPPSPWRSDDGFGLQFTLVDGVYSSTSSKEGAAGTNVIEARAVVDAVARHARNNPQMSLGIVSVSVKQRNMIAELLEHERRSDPVLDNFLWEGRAEDVFVKSIENIQGDERDVILISVGYGPDQPGGRLASVNFGPINAAGGERRVNVLFSRARMLCRVFASFDPGDIDLSRTRNDGLRIFRRFLDFAQTRNFGQDSPAQGNGASPLEEDIADVVRSLGYAIDHKVGIAGLQVDLGVRHPDDDGQFMLGIECDGATYYNAPWARERDRLRQEALERQGWRYHRIWSNDWFYNRTQEIERLAEKLEQARAESRDGFKVDGANANHLSPDRAAYVSDYRAKLIKDYEPRSEAYILADVKAKGGKEPQKASQQQLSELVTAIVGVEGPIHQDQVAHRLASAFGKARAGKKINELTLDTLNKAHAVETDPAPETKILNEDLFWFTQLQAQDVPVRNRAGQRATIQKVSNIAPLEIRAAIGEIKHANGRAKTDELIRRTAQLLGFEAVKPDLKAAISRQIKKLSKT